MSICLFDGRVPFKSKWHGNGYKPEFSSYHRGPDVTQRESRANLFGSIYIYNIYSW